MTNKDAKAHRTLHVKIRAASPDAMRALSSMVKSAAPLYQAFGDMRVRLLRNADDPAQFIQVIEYQADQAVELSRQKMASDPITHNFVQAWRSLFPGAVEVDVYEDVTENA